MLRITNRIKPLFRNGFNINKQFLFQQLKSEPIPSQEIKDVTEFKSTIPLDVKIEKDQPIPAQVLMQLTSEVYQDNGQAMLKKAKEGDAVAQFVVGWFYENGLVVQHNELKAAEWYEQAATQNQPDAIAALGRIYLFYPTLKDEKKAASYFKLICHLDNHLGQYARTYCQTYGLNQPQNISDHYYKWKEVAEKGYVRAQSVHATNVDCDSPQKEEFLKKAMAQNYRSAMKKLSDDFYGKQDNFSASINEKILDRILNSAICNPSQFIAAEQKWGKNFGHLVPLDTVEFKYEKHADYIFYDFHFHYYVIAERSLRGVIQEVYYSNLVTGDKKQIPVEVQIEGNYYRYFTCLNDIDNNLICIYEKENIRIIGIWNNDATKFVLITYYQLGKFYASCANNALFLFSTNLIQIFNLENPFNNQNGVTSFNSKTITVPNNQSFKQLNILFDSNELLYLIIYANFKMSLLNSQMKPKHEFLLNDLDKREHHNRFSCNRRLQKLFHFRTEKDYAFLLEKSPALVVDIYDLKQGKFLETKMILPRFTSSLEDLKIQIYDEDENFLVIDSGIHAQPIMVDCNTMIPYPLQTADETNPSFKAVVNISLLQYTLINNVETARYYAPQFVLNDASKKCSELLQQKTEMPRSVCNIVKDYMSRKDLFFQFARKEKEKSNPAFHSNMPAIS